ncbi:MAG: tRNA (adenosine(37)-N6)-threonylcarbamoyltransferase complex dimerization subunit type 1 TsaB [Armatimonadetes bacterium]|nr:tRNA (adenosine(37)-N6)-threonylcarbamoyltransferase complex dimerization subunit type 1 TsaB [Armatimonadota bacterium]
MTFLAMDTSGDHAVLALADEGAGGALRAARVFHGRRSLSRRLLGEVDGLLVGEGMTLADVSALAVGLGPGSFTGVRVGVTTAKTLAQVTGKPLVGVPTLNAYAEAWGQDVPTLVVILPSRRGEAYAAVYRAAEPLPEPFAESVEAMERRLKAMVEAGEQVACCGAIDLLAERPGLSRSQPHVPPEGLARAAAGRLNNGLTDDPLALVPLYVVPPAISTPKNAFPAPQLLGAGEPVP